MKKLNTEEFIRRSNLIHNNKYDYSLSEYIQIEKKVKIICPEHGIFEQSPNAHMVGKQCMKCSIIASHLFSTKTHDKFVEELKLIQPSLEVISTYQNDSTKILVKDLDGIEYLVKPTNLLFNKTPTILSSVSKSLAFSIKANIVHNNKYDYSKSIYIDAFSKIIIICPIHGEFTQSPGNHIFGQGCPSCREFGYTKSQWVEFCDKKKNANPLIYIIRCYNDNEQFIKIGRTSNSVNKRFRSKKELPYEYEIIKETKGSAGFIYDKEKELHRLYKDYKYNPLLYFEGQTECFTTEILNLITP